MSWTLSSYIARRFTGVLFAIFAGVTALIILLNLVELMRRGASAGLGFTGLLELAALKAPAISITAAPFAVLLGAMACYAMLARSSELVVTRGAGVSVWRVLAPAVICAALVGVIAFAAYNPIASAMTARYETLEARSFHGRASRLSLSPEGLWLRQGARERQDVIHARRSNGDATILWGVSLFQFGENDELLGRLEAVRAELVAGAWLLRDVRRWRLNAEGALEPSAETFQTYRVITDLTREQILDSFASPETISFWDLPGFIETLDRSGFSARRHVLHWHTLLAAPLLYAAMVLIGGAFSMRHARFGGLGAMAFGCAATGFGFYFISDLAQALAGSGAIAPQLAAWAPPAAAVMLAAGLLLHLEDG